jgi:hypothetical protein
MPGLLIIVIFTRRGQEGQVLPLVIWLQRQISRCWPIGVIPGVLPLLHRRRLIVLCALCFDDILTLLWQLAARPPAVRFYQPARYRLRCQKSRKEFHAGSVRRASVRCAGYSALYWRSGMFISIIYRLWITGHVTICRL